MLADARRWQKPLAWWTVGDPNAFAAFLDQAQQGRDLVLTQHTYAHRLARLAEIVLG
jgi:hypothetical protein